MKRMRRLIAIALASVACAGSAAAAPGPVLRLTATSPLSVHGSGFKAREHVTVFLAGRTAVTRRVVATPSGTFTVRFAQPAARCLAFVVRAAGDLGSSAQIKLRARDCAQP
jgi:hypothetical protein